MNERLKRVATGLSNTKKPAKNDRRKTDSPRFSWKTNRVKCATKHHCALAKKLLRVRLLLRLYELIAFSNPSNPL